MTDTPVRAWLSLGSNIEPEKNLALGVAELERRFGKLELSPVYRAPAIGLAWEAMSAQTGVGVDEVGHFDIYSCFPSAVQIACREIGLAPLDERGVTLRSEDSKEPISEPDEARVALDKVMQQFLRVKLPKLAYLGMVAPA